VNAQYFSQATSFHARRIVCEPTIVLTPADCMRAGWSKTVA